MKIRTKLSLRYAGITAAVFTAFVLTIYIFSDKNREREFFRDLKKEAVTKTNLFLRGMVDAETMHTIYSNNREFINEVEVAVYTTDFRLLYHDALQNDLVKETPEMAAEILARGSIEFYEGPYQVIGMVYPFSEERFIVTAAAYDGYGIAKVTALKNVLILCWLAGLAVIFLAGYYLARAALSPVVGIVKKVETISGASMDQRLPVAEPKDELGELSDRFNEMLDRLEKSFEAQKMFIGNVSHELRTPLAALIAELELAGMKERTCEEYRRVIGHALDDARGLNKLISGLLDLAKANYDPARIIREEIRLDEVLLEARETILKAQPDATVDLVFEQEIEDENGITVYGNPYLLSTAFSNLIENNCKFSANRTSRVLIASEGDQAILRFTDTGIGMSEKEKEEIFVPFHRGENARYARGYGLGMPLTEKIVQMHHGTIDILSEKGEGTVFTVSLPNRIHSNPIL